MSAVTDFLGEIGESFYSIVTDMQSNGWLEFLFPFLLIYALVFTVTEKIDLVRTKKGVRVIIALTVSLFSIAYPITEGGQTIGGLMNSLFPGISAFSIGIIALYIIAGLAGVDLMALFSKDNQDTPYMRYIIGGLGVLFVLFYFARGFGWISDGSELYNNWLIDFIFDPVLLMLVIFGLLMWWINTDSENLPLAARREIYNQWLADNPRATDTQKKRKRKQLNIAESQTN